MANTQVANTQVALLQLRFRSRTVAGVASCRNAPCARSLARAHPCSSAEHMTGKYAVPVPGTNKYEVTLEGNFWPSIPGNGSNW